MEYNCFFGAPGGRRSQGVQDDEATASDSCNRMDEEPSGMSLLQSRNASNDHLAEFTGSRMAGVRKPSQRAGSISIKLLLEEGIISPGKEVLQMEYKGVSHTADLTEDGKIQVDIDGKLLVFDSPSAFSIHLKRLVNPTRKADDGWKSVKYNGNFLEHYKLELARKMFGLDSSGLGDDVLLPRRSKKQRSLLLTDAEPPPSPPRSPRVRTPFNSNIGADTKEYIVPLREYSDDQPFELRVAPMAEAVIDFHSHLCHDEVAGVLLGTVDGDVVNVLMALPMETKEYDTGSAVARLEMNDGDLDKQLRRIQSKDADILVIGYYHSHPDFAPHPTIIDTLYAARETLAMRGSNPCIQCIVSPYDKEAPSVDVAAVSWYHMSIPAATDSIPDNTSPESFGCFPYSLSYRTYTGDKVDVCDVATLQKTIEHLAKIYAPSKHRVNIEGMWRKTDEGQVVLRIRKLIRSFEAKLSQGPFFGKLRSFANFKLEVLVRAVWSVYGRRSTVEQVEETSRGPKSVMMSNQNSESLAGMSSMQENGTSEPASDDEPISDDEEQTE